jgi:hypothetical protein
MSSLTIAIPTRRPALSYLKNLREAAVALVSALRATRLRGEIASADSATLYQVANQYQHSMPNLASELRFLPSRG